MPSKYDFYWQKRLVDIKDLLEEAYEKGVSRQINVSGLKVLEKDKAGMAILFFLKVGLRDQKWLIQGPLAMLFLKMHFFLNLKLAQNFIL